MSPPGADYYDKSNINELELWPIVEGLRGDVKMQVAATATVCSRLQKVAIFIFQFRLI